MPIVTVLSLFPASLLNSCTKLQGLFQTCYFLPMVVRHGGRPRVEMDVQLRLRPDQLCAVAVRHFPVNWLNDPHYNLAALIIYGIWSMLPFTIILLLSGFQNINPAVLHGRAHRRCVLRAHFPPHHRAAAGPDAGPDDDRERHFGFEGLLRAVPAVQRQPGSAYSLYTVVYYLFDMFYKQWQLGPAAASAVVLFVIVLIFTMLQLFIQRKWKNY